MTRIRHPEPSRIVFRIAGLPRVKRHEDVADEYAVVADPEADCGLVIWARYGTEWLANPWSTRALLRHVLERIGVRFDRSSEAKEESNEHKDC